MGREHISPWRRTRLRHDGCRRRRKDPWSRSPKSVDYCWSFFGSWIPDSKYGRLSLVGSGTDAVIRGRRLGRIRGFPLRARVGVAVIPSPVPAASHAACGLAALPAPAPRRGKSYGPYYAEVAVGHGRWRTRYAAK